MDWFCSYILIYVEYEMIFRQTQGAADHFDLTVYTIIEENKKKLVFNFIKQNINSLNHRGLCVLGEILKMTRKYWNVFGLLKIIEIIEVIIADVWYVYDERNSK